MCRLAAGSGELFRHRLARDALLHRTVLTHTGRRRDHLTTEKWLPPLSRLPPPSKSATSSSVQMCGRNPPSSAVMSGVVGESIVSGVSVSVDSEKTWSEVPAKYIMDLQVVD
ncbi:lon protease 1 [Striga asiatica]|uniref:Lon protease 1 n=1 Tax=Striga asiatica TaxID=4170 RepID=A0A5A7PP50_STRAF|nr:lon protease 1 [Striga asiatica]